MYVVAVTDVRTSVVITNSSAVCVLPRSITTDQIYPQTVPVPATGLCAAVPELTGIRPLDGHHPVCSWMPGDQVGGPSGPWLLLQKDLVFLTRGIAILSVSKYCISHMLL